jgi:hypothetical protein
MQQYKYHEDYDPQLKTELKQFLEQTNALELEDVEELLKKELEYKLVTKEILDMKLFKIRSMKLESLDCYSIIKSSVFNTTPERKDYS